MNKRRIIKGERFGRLTIVRELEKKSTHRAFECRCECGNVTVSSLCNLMAGHTRSCGCLAKEVRIAVFTTHGQTNSAEYNAWRGMRQRCLSPDNPEYERYGARGIKVCERWRSFENFIADIGEKPSPSHSIDRINNDMDYSPDNCKWSTPKEQARNRRTSLMLEFNGIRQSAAAWGEQVGVGYKIISQRIKRGWSVEKTLTTPTA